MTAWALGSRRLLHNQDAVSACSTASRAWQAPAVARHPPAQNQASPLRTCTPGRQRAPGLCWSAGASSSIAVAADELDADNEVDGWGSDEEHENPQGDAGASQAHRPSVVQVLVTKDLPRYDMPLLLGSVRAVTRAATAVRYRGRRFLVTTASSVLYATEVKVRVPGAAGHTYPAEVEHLCMEADLALLCVASPPRAAASAPTPGHRRQQQLRVRRPQSRPVGGAGSPEQAAPPFWDAVRPLELAAALPQPQDRVNVIKAGTCGHHHEHHLPNHEEPKEPLSSQGDVDFAVSGGGAGAGGGGEDGGVAGRVARVEVAVFALASFRLLAVLVATGVRGKEHLGAAVVDCHGRCLGVAVDQVRASGHGTVRKVAGGRRRGALQGEDCLQVLPATVLRYVLNDVLEHGEPLGFAQLGIRYKSCEAHALRAYLGLSPEQHGALVLDVNPTSAAAGVLQPGDIITHLEREPVGDDGNMAFELGGRVSITHRVSQLRVLSTTCVSVVRSGRPLDLELRLSVPHRLVPSHLSGRPPSYLVLGGLVLSVLSVPFLEQTFGRGNAWLRMAPPKLAALAGEWPADGEEEAVVVAHCEEDVAGMQGYRADLVQHQRVIAFWCRAAPTSTSIPHTSEDGDACTMVGAAPARREGGGGEGWVRVHTLRQLAAAVLPCRQGEVWLELGDGSVVVLGAAQAAADARQLVQEYDAPARVSKDLADLLAAPAGGSAAPVVRLGQPWLTLRASK